jgi:hypothetical protein
MSAARIAGEYIPADRLTQDLGEPPGAGVFSYWKMYDDSYLEPATVVWLIGTARTMARRSGASDGEAQRHLEHAHHVGDAAV